MFVTFYGLPLLCIATLYTALFILVKRRQGLISNATRDRASAINRKVTRMVLMVTTSFLLCWLLYFTAMPLEEFCAVMISCEVHFLRMFFGHVNSACEPVICLIFSENYKNGIKRCFLGKMKWKRLQDNGINNKSLLRRQSRLDQFLNHSLEVITFCKILECTTG